MKKIFHILSIALLSMSFFYLYSTIAHNQSLFTKRYDPKKMKNLYNESQWNESQNISPMKALDTWALKNNYTGWNNYVDENKSKTDTEKRKNDILTEIKNKGISDAQLYSYVGYEYIRGINPTLLNPEHPPLGKYLIGLSILLFHNEYIILLICGLISLFTIYCIIFITTNNHLSASIGVLLTSTHTLFIDQLIHGPQLELFQLMFFLLIILFFLLYEKKKSIWLLLLISLNFGFLCSIKTFSTYFPLFLIWSFINTIFSKNFKIPQWIMLQFIGIIVFTTTYLQFFVMGGTVRQFLGVQKYIILFYKQSGINIIEFAGNYLRLIFTGKWKFWSENSPFSHYSEWSITWPFLFIIFLIIFFYLYKNNHVKILFIEKVLAGFIVLYNIFLFIIPMFPRYLLLLFVPIILLISVYSRRMLKYEK